MSIFPGDYQINEISIKFLDGTTIDVRYLMEELNIYESIFNNTLSGNIILNDSLNLPANKSISGHEVVTINISLPDTDYQINLQFRIYKQTTVNGNSEGKQTYVLYFASEEFIEDKKQKVSQSWKFQYADKIIKDILKIYFPNSNKQILTEEPFYKQNIVVPSWSPLKTINWLTNRSVTKPMTTGGSAANFLFFEQADGFIFQSVSNMLTKPLARHPFTGNDLTYIYHPGSYKTDGISNINEDFIAIKNYNFENTFDMMMNLAMGFYASKLTSYDIAKKEVKSFNFDLAENWDKQVHLEPAKKPHGQGSSIPANLTEGNLFKSYNQFEMLFPKHFNLFGDNDAMNECSEKYPEQWLQGRLSQLQSLSHIRLNIKVPGNLTNRVGTLVEVMLPSNEPQSSTMIYDKYRKGKYLIAGLRHQFLKVEYITHLQLLKDSLAEALPVKGNVQ